MIAMRLRRIAIVIGESLATHPSTTVVDLALPEGAGCFSTRNECKFAGPLDPGLSLRSPIEKQIQLKYKEAAEKLDISSEIAAEPFSEAEARVASVGLMRGLKPPPPSDRVFSAACKALVECGVFAARLKSCPVTKHVND
jgi:hypothetical protein